MLTRRLHRRRKAFSLRQLTNTWFPYSDGMTISGITALLDKADVQESDRIFILSMHIFLRGSRGDAKILRLAEAWLELAPRLLSVAGGRREMIEWVSEAAKAYAMLSAAAIQVRPKHRLP